MTTIRRQPSAVWSDDESRLLRRKSRLFERRYRRTGLASDRLLSVQHERTRHEVNRIKENGYWLARISEHSGQPSKLWRTFPSIMGLDRVTATTNPLRTTRESHVTLLCELCLILYVDESSCNIKRIARVEMEWRSCEIHVWRPFLHVAFSPLFQRASNHVICNTLLIRLLS